MSKNPIDVSRARVDKVRSATRTRVMDPADDYSYADLMGDMTSTVRELVDVVYRTEAQRLYGTTQVPGFALFLYGSPARCEMTSYTDIDIHIIDDDRDDTSAELKRRISGSLSTFGFGKIDDPNWENLETVELYVARSITEGNQIIDADYVCGDRVIADRIEGIRLKHDTLERNVRNIFFQRYYLDHYYSRRSTVEVPNVKYCVGGYRELLTFNWFDKVMKLYNPSWDKGDGTGPWVRKALANLRDNEMISEDDFNHADTSIGFVTLLRNEMLHANLGTSDQ